MDYTRIAAREFGVQFCAICTRSISPEVKGGVVPAPFYGEIFVPEDGNEVCCVHTAGWKRFGDALKKRYLWSEANFKTLDAGFFRATSGALAMVERIANADIKQESDKALAKMFIDYMNNDLHYIAYDWTLWELNNIYANETKEVLERLGQKAGLSKEKILAMYGVVLSPENKSPLYKLRAVAVRWPKMSLSERKKLHIKYRWIPCPDYHYPAFTFRQFSDYVKNIKTDKKKDSITYERAMAILKPSKRERALFDRTRRMVYLKDFKDDIKRTRFCDAQVMYGEIARRMGMTLTDASYMTSDEMIGFLTKGTNVDKKVVGERMESGFVLYYDESHKVRCVSGEGVAAALQVIGYQRSSTASEEIRGVTASQGYAKGRAIVVSSMSELHKVKKGDIMIAISTIPDFVPAMERAAGIIAEEGGITSHAAIVSRELKLPCIVGAANVTKIIRDGDLVELDADNGIARILK
ncbi:MAG TPA: PEP-utilizing enzyme [Candidatus Acidoferrales bacterium]|nr:PEP-utilizing enzyme [Candidatus Acidoferrales bacterium]